MRYLAAYLLLQLGGNANPSAADITKVKFYFLNFEFIKIEIFFI